MKRRITVEDLQQLTPEQQQKLRELWKPKWDDLVMDFRGKESRLSIESNNFYLELYGKDGLKKYSDTKLPLLNIGQMIELLPLCYSGEGKYWTSTDYDKPSHFGIWWEGEELCDALWKEVKEEL